MASLILHMLRYLFKYISFVFYSVELLTNSAAASGFLCTDRRRRHRRHLRFCLPAEWAMQTGKQHITQAFRGPLSRGLLPCVVGCGSSPKGRGLWSCCCCCCCCWRTRWLSKRGTATTAGRAGNQQRTTRGAIVPIERIARAASSCRLRRSGDRLISRSVSRSSRIERPSNSL